MEINLEEMHLRDYIRIIRKRKFVVLAFFFVAFILVFLWTMAATPKYIAASKLLVEMTYANPLNERYIRYDPTFLETQSEIIKSERVTRKVVQNLNLEAKYETFFQKEGKELPIINAVKDYVKEGLASLRQKDEQAPKEPVSKEEKIANSIISNLTIKPVRETKIIEIEFESESPALSQLVANAVANAYMEELQEIKMHSSGYTIKWMTVKAEEQRAKLVESEEKMQKYLRDNDIVSLEDKVAILPQRLAELSSQLTVAENRKKELESLYSRVKEIADRNVEDLDSVQYVAENSEVSALTNEIQKTERLILEQSKKLGPKHPTMLKLEVELVSLQSKRKDALLKVVSSLKNEYELAAVHVENIANFLAKTKAETFGMNEKFIKYNELKRDVETNRTLYESLLSSLKERSITEESQAVNVWVVEEAKLPGRPGKPNIRRNLLLGILLGCFGGIALAFFIEYIDNTIKNPEEAEKITGLAALGVVEKVRLKKIPGELALLSMEDPLCSYSESIKALRTSILLSSASQPPRIMAVTSMLPEEGKTTIAVNIAITLAQAGHKVLLVDSDMRKPRIHKLFGLDNDMGLSHYLAGTTGSDIVKNSTVGNLKIITAGSIPPNPSELLSSKRMPAMLEAAVKKFNFVVFDTAPVTPVTDTRILSKMVDGLVIVARAEKTTYDIIRKGVKSLLDIDANILGMVINGFDLKKNRYYYGKEYSQSYGTYGAKSKS
jgi:succinoglycan biosynthesis transport protein ExoP